MNEVLTTVKKPVASKQQFNEFYKKYDKDGDGELDKEEMTKFIKEYLKNPPKADHLQEQHDALQRQKTLAAQKKNEEALRKKEQELLDKIK